MQQFKSMRPRFREEIIMSDPAFIFWFIVLSLMIFGGLHLASKIEDSPEISPFMRWRSADKVEKE
jgi:hypothetical protein